MTARPALPSRRRPKLGLAATAPASVGDDAFWNGTIDVMFVRKGNRAFTIASSALGAKTPTDPDAPKAAMVTLATAAQANL